MRGIEKADIRRGMVIATPGSGTDEAVQVQLAVHIEANVAFTETLGQIAASRDGFRALRQLREGRKSGSSSRRTTSNSRTSGGGGSLSKSKKVANPVAEKVEKKKKQQ